MKHCPKCRKPMDGRAAKPAKRSPLCTRCKSQEILDDNVARMGELAASLPPLAAVSTKQFQYATYCRLRLLASLNHVMVRTIAVLSHERYLRVRRIVSRVVNRYDDASFWIKAWRDGTDITGEPFVNKPATQVYHNGHYMDLRDIIRSEVAEMEYAA